MLLVKNLILIKLTSEFAARLEPGSLASKNDIDNLVNEDRYW